MKKYQEDVSNFFGVSPKKSLKKYNQNQDFAEETK